MKEEKNRTYNGWLVSNNILKRSLAVFLHMALIEIIIFAIIFFVFVALAF